MSNKIDVAEKHAHFNMSNVVAVINAEQWQELCRLAYGNEKLKAFMLDILGNDDIFNGVYGNGQ